jgi:hypothetical protein
VWSWALILFVYEQVMENTRGLNLRTKKCSTRAGSKSGDPTGEKGKSRAGQGCHGEGIVKSCMN